jgi:hypothetical protein
MNNTGNTLMKNPRVDVRKRNLDTSKTLSIVKSREELKKFEYFFSSSKIFYFCRNIYTFEDCKEDEVEKLTSLIHKKKFEILVPEIMTVAPAAPNATSDNTLAIP